jgi:hypothetical protein
MQQIVATPVGALPSDTGALAFSPDQALLLSQLGDKLAIVTLQVNGRSGWFSVQDGLVAPDPCNEEFVAGPESWCGKAKRGHSPVWGPDSRYAATEAAGHAVRIYDFGRYVSDGLIPSVNACETGCSGDFAFQP